MKWSIQVCTGRGKFDDFDPDAICMAMETSFFGIRAPRVEAPPEPDAFCLSTDGEHYDSRFLTEQEAIDEAVAWGCEVFYIGKPEKPSQPEEFWFVDEWISHVSEQDDYGGEYADGWYDGTREQEKELEEQVRPVLAAWLDRHKLRPKHWMIRSFTKYIVVEGKVMTEAELNGVDVNRQVDAVARGTELLSVKASELPPLALEYRNKLCAEFGMCIEVILTAFCHFAQCVEGLSCSDEWYQATPEAKEWFKARIDGRQSP